MTPEELDAIERRANDATPGPWGTSCLGEYVSGPNGIVADVVDGTDEKRAANLSFIAAARIDVPLLIAEIRRLRRELGRLSSLADDAFDALGWDNYGNPDD